MSEASLEKPVLAMMVARGRNGVIGAEGDLPWRLSSDLKLFKATTSGKPVIMGRKTWDSLPFKPLPGRLNIVITRNTDYAAEGAEVCHDLDSAIARGLEQARADGAGEVFIIGGAQIYAAALPVAQRLYITEVQAEPQGDARFPDLQAGTWRELKREAFPASEKDDHAFEFCILERSA